MKYNEVACFVNDGEKFRYLTVAELWECQKKLPFSFISIQPMQNPSETFLPFTYHLRIKCNRFNNRYNIRNFKEYEKQFWKVKIQRMNCKDCDEILSLANTEGSYKGSIENETNKIVKLIESSSKGRIKNIEAIFVVQINKSKNVLLNNTHDIWLVGCVDIALKESRFIKEKARNIQMEEINNEINYSLTPSANKDDLLVNYLSFLQQKTNETDPVSSCEKVYKSTKKLRHLRFKFARNALKLYKPTTSLEHSLIVKKIGPPEIHPISTKSGETKMKCRRFSRNKCTKPILTKEANSQSVLEEPCLLYKTYSPIKEEKTITNFFITNKKKPYKDFAFKTNENNSHRNEMVKIPIKLLSRKAQVFQRDKKKKSVQEKIELVSISMNNERIIANEYRLKPIFNVIVKRSSSKPKITN